MVRICAEESFHNKQGIEICLTLARGTPVQRSMVQDAVNRWWWPTLMMFGPHDADSPNTPMLVRWGIKSRTNDELRQEFVDQTVPQAQAMGLSLPDPELHFDEDRSRWSFGEIDWGEFWRVVGGDGPCNRERLAARQAAHDDGLWVRQALEAYAARA
jgi:ring-1,2-phenylacetyl-CoA epoxidase subunit PaaA